MGIITNKFLSAEILGTLVFTAFSIGIAWASLDTKAENTKLEVANLTEQQAIVAHDMHRIKTDMAVLRNEQQHIRSTINEIKEQNKELSTIRQLLENMK